MMIWKIFCVIFGMVGMYYLSKLIDQIIKDVPDRAISFITATRWRGFNTDEYLINTAVATICGIVVKLLW
jgi:hypothetical protein